MHSIQQFKFLLALLVCFSIGIVAQGRGRELQFQGKVLRIAFDDLRTHILVKFDVLKEEYKLAATTHGPLYECLENSLKTSASVHFSFDTENSRIKSCN